MFSNHSLTLQQIHNSSGNQVINPQRVKVELQRLSALEGMIFVILWDCPERMATTLISHTLCKDTTSNCYFLYNNTNNTIVAHLASHRIRVCSPNFYTIIWWFWHYWDAVSLCVCVCMCVCIENSHLLSGLLESFLTFLL